MAYTIRAAVVGDIDTLVAFTVRAAYEAEHLATDEAAVRRGVEGAFRNPPLATYWVVETSDNRLVELMLDHLATAAETSGALDLRLYAHRSNERALRAYRRCGFAVAPYVIMTRSRRQAPTGEAIERANVGLTSTCGVKRRTRHRDMCLRTWQCVGSG